MTNLTELDILTAIVEDVRWTGFFIKPERSPLPWDEGGDESKFYTALREAGVRGVRAEILKAGKVAYPGLITFSPLHDYERHAVRLQSHANIVLTRDQIQHDDDTYKLILLKPLMLVPDHRGALLRIRYPGVPIFALEGEKGG
jgi:hypothetical protein